MTSNDNTQSLAPEAAGVLDEAYERLHLTGPEFEGWLSNHGPMAVEAMARHNHAADVHSWLDDYVGRLEEFPRGTGPVGEDWREALGDPRRIADWTVFFRREISEQPWPDVLGTWWPRLLPAVTASATHGVIRVGHAVRTLLADGDNPAHLTELAHGLAYWAARWQPLPGTTTEPGEAAAAPGPGEPQQHTPALRAALAAVPRLADQTGGFRARLPRLDETPGWAAALAAPDLPGSAEESRVWLAALADAATLHYLDYGHGSPVMLVHAATAPTAILRTLPALSPDAWPASAAAAWGAAATITAIYAPSQAAPPEAKPASPADADPVAEVMAQAVEHGDEHVIKFADTAADVYTRTGDPAALAAAVQAANLTPRPE